jgi:hypothetical protein
MTAVTETPPRLGWPHLLMLLPGVGALATLALASGRSDERERVELRTAAKWQGLAFLVVTVHATLQAGIEFVGWAFRTLPPDYLDSSPVYQHLPLLFRICTHANVVAFLAEWGILVWFGAQAARGVAYPGRAGFRR